MKSVTFQHSLNLINGYLDENGRLRSYLSSTTPIEGFVCKWPDFPVLPPPDPVANAIVKTHSRRIQGD